MNGSTHLRCDVMPNPLTVAVTPSNVLEASEGDGSTTGWMVPEIIKTYVLTQNIRKRFSYVLPIYTIKM
jgi:hypothetical protein